MNKKQHTLLLGAHISVSGGLDQAFARGESIGCTTMQIFTKSNRQWMCKPLSEVEISAFKTAWEGSYIQDIVVHAAYLINIGSAQSETVEKSTNALIQELLRCTQLDIPYLVLHPGSNKDQAREKTITQVAQQLDRVFEAVPGKSMILLETMAGQGSNLCAQFEELAAIYSASQHKDRIGVCFDTCHAFAAGYSMQTKEEYESMWQHFDTILGLDRLKVIHVNDSKKELGSRVDRHEHIGKGKLGAETFQLLFNDPRFFSIPKILETPKENPTDDWDNMQNIISLLDVETRKIMEIKVPEVFPYEAKKKQ